MAQRHPYLPELSYLDAILSGSLALTSITMLVVSSLRFYFSGLSIICKSNLYLDLILVLSLSFE